MASKPSSAGGPVAIRGYLVQTLVALLDMTRADRPFTEITLEPTEGEEQFDFRWTDGRANYATQVKSTANSFQRSDLVAWAEKLQAAGPEHHCRLILVGNIPPSLIGFDRHDRVSFEMLNDNSGQLLDQAEALLARFLEREKLPEGSATERGIIVRALVAELLNLSKSSTPLSRANFIQLLSTWIRKAPRDGRKIDVSHFDVFEYAPDQLIGRESETQLLTDTWNSVLANTPGRTRVLTFVALGGEGKTSLVADWTATLAGQDWPGCEAVFAWSFYSQGSREQSAASSDTFLQEALIFFGDPGLAYSAQHAGEKGRRLAQLVGRRQALLILDGVEPLQYPPGPPMDGRLKDDGISKLLKGLAADSRGLCVVTTRYAIQDLKTYRKKTVHDHELKPLSIPAGVALLKSLGVIIGSKTDFETLVRDVDGHALTLQIVGGYLKRAHGGDVRKRDRVKFDKADAAIQGGHAFRAMAAYTTWLQDNTDQSRRELSLLSLMGLFDRPATSDCIDALLKPPAIVGLTDPLVNLSEEDRNLALDALRSTKLLSVNRDNAGSLVSLDAHPLIREYFANHLRNKQLNAWRAGHKQLYEHLCTTAPECTKFGERDIFMQKLGMDREIPRPLPTLQDLQPLYQAIVHGCYADLHQNACDHIYFLRILRGSEHAGFYSEKQLGAIGSDLGAIVCFFEQPWNRVSPALNEGDQAWLLNEAALRLRSLGRLAEGLEAIRASLGMRTNKNWEQAARIAGNLSELELTLGDIADAVRDADLAVTYADLSANIWMTMINHTTHADALHRANHTSAAEALFQKAEQVQAKLDTKHPLLYSLRGFLYCDLLLSTPEQTVWRATLFSRSENPFTDLSQACRAVSQRAATTINWATNPSLLDIALNHLSLARANLCHKILDNATFNPSSFPLAHINNAVDGFRRAGTQHHLPRGLLTRSWYRVLTNNPAGAIADLNEAWEIAERGPMRLHMADIHLYRARLFYKIDPYPWADNLWRTNSDGSSADPDADEPPRTAADDLADARRLIEQCGYWRRKEELEDAERAILGLAHD